METIVPSIGSPVDRLVLIGRKLKAIQEMLQEAHDIDTVRVEVRSHLGEIKQILDDSFEAEESFAEAIWRMNNSRLAVVDKSLQQPAEEKPMKQAALKLGFIRASINEWMKRILETDLPQVSGLQVRLEPAYFSHHSLAQELLLKELLRKQSGE